MLPASTPASVLSNRRDFLDAVSDWRSMNLALEEVFGCPASKNFHVVHTMHGAPAEELLAALASLLGWTRAFLSDVLGRVLQEDPPRGQGGHAVEGYVLGVVLSPSAPPRYTVMPHDDFRAIRARRPIAHGILRRHIRWWKMVTEWAKAIS